jgi:tetratricopeptide (TPR) repeat protein
VGKTGDVGQLRLYIECQRVHVSGYFEEQSQLAQEGVQYLDKHPDAPLRLLLAIAQVHYDAGKSSGDAAWFDQSLNIGQRMIDRAKTPREEATGRHFVGISLPLRQRDQRKQQLRQAMELVQHRPEGDREEAELLGRIMGSLAEELGRGTDEERQEAKSLFERRLKLNETQKVGDPRGLAMTHGGLGRLAFYGKPQDIPTARQHFQKDLEISEAIGDLQGQIQMHSLLGACALAENDLSAAQGHYEQSWELSRAPISRFFAGAGLISCYARSHQNQPLQDMVRQLLALAEQRGIPVVCRDEIAAALAECPSECQDRNSQRLLDIARGQDESEA